MRRRANWLCVVAAVIVIMAAAGCRTTGAVHVPRPFPMEPATAAAQASPAPEVPEVAGVWPPLIPPLIQVALDLRGIPYRNGGVDPEGFDCSGFTQYVFGRVGVQLPRNVRDQFGVGQTIRTDQLAPGDLLFFSTTEPGPSHVGIALGSDEFIHAPSSTGVVRIERLSVTYWSRRFLGGHRVDIPSAPPADPP
jgi:cell wall-associated NlpC family hydrolase